MDLHPKKQACYKLLWSQLCSVCYRPCACISSTEGATKILVTADDPLGGGDGQEQEEFRLGQTKQWTTSHWDWMQQWGISFFQVCLPDSLSGQNRWKHHKVPLKFVCEIRKHLVGAHPRAGSGAGRAGAPWAGMRCWRMHSQYRCIWATLTCPSRADGSCLHS